MGRFELPKRGPEQVKRGLTFEDYFYLVAESPHIADSAHTRVAKAIDLTGFEGWEVSDDTRQKVLQYFNAAREGLPIKKRILTLVGNVDKSRTLTKGICQSLETYSQTEAGAMYAIKGCPLHEEPLHLIPDRERCGIESDFGIHIEGDLCPHCQAELKDTYDNKQEDVRVERFQFSDKEGVGMSKLFMEELENQDMGKLIGTVDLKAFAEVGTASDPRAYQFYEGAIPRANRGVMEFIGLFTASGIFSYPLLTLSEEQSVKMPRFALSHLDQVLLVHATYEEMEHLAERQKNEALKDRIYPICIN